MVASRFTGFEINNYVYLFIIDLLILHYSLSSFGYFDQFVFTLYLIFNFINIITAKDRVDVFTLCHPKITEWIALKITIM